MLIRINTRSCTKQWTFETSPWQPWNDELIYDVWMMKNGNVSRLVCDRAARVADRPGGVWRVGWGRREGCDSGDVKGHFSLLPQHLDLLSTIFSLVGASWRLPRTIAPDNARVARDILFRIIARARGPVLSIFRPVRLLLPVTMLYFTLFYFILLSLSLFSPLCFLPFFSFSLYSVLSRCRFSAAALALCYAVAWPSSCIRLIFRCHPWHRFIIAIQSSEGSSRELAGRCVLKTRVQTQRTFVFRLYAITNVFSDCFTYGVYYFDSLFKLKLLQFMMGRKW